VNGLQVTDRLLALLVGVLFPNREKTQSKHNPYLVLAVYDMFTW